MATSATELIDSLGTASGRYLYRAVTDILRQRIRAGIYSPGSRIPPLAELAAEFKVSAITVRHAIRDLSLEGMLIGRQGLGVFVAHKRRIIRSLSVDRIVPIEQDMLASGVTASLEDQGVKMVSPSDEPFLTELGRGQKRLLRLDRILLADGQPVGLDVLWMTNKLGKKFGNRLHGHFIMSQLEKLGVTVERIIYQVQASTATEAQASTLGTVSGLPLLVIRFFPVDPAGQPILVGQTSTRADRFTYEFGAKLK
jgi:DNA-binding GntR family transcriptional regulator